ncbi:MAG: HAMP domain-containing protein [Anaerolineae bacterium]|nr:HAMP domain-containing protein [Anaerolineae bacterium]
MKRLALPLRVRLALLYGLVLAAVLVIFGAATHSVLSYVLLRDVDRRLTETAQRVLTATRVQVQPLLNVRLIELPQLEVFSSPGLYIQVMDAEGVVHRRSANLGSATLPSDETTWRELEAGRTVRQDFRIGDTRLRVLSVPLVLEDGHMAGVLQVGASLWEVDAILQRLLTILVGGSLLAVAISMLLGIWLARTALEPIDEITRAALRISRAEDLHQRLPAPAVQDEVGRLTDTFNEMLGRLEDLFATQKRLVADVSHELRTPLTTIRGNIDLLRRGAAEDPEAREEALMAMEAETVRMSRMVSDLLLLARADAGLPLERKPVELDTLFLEVYRQALLISDGVEVHIGHEDQAVVLGDADRLRQALVNLVDNAIKYTPRGGEVWLSLYRDQEWVRLEVRDTGIGIAPEDLPHIFERFYRADRARSSSGGTGLGLSIADWIARAHGGQITVRSKVGEGSTFTLWLPPYRRAKADGAPPRPPRPRPEERSEDAST